MSGALSGKGGPLKRCEKYLAIGFLYCTLLSACRTEPKEGLAQGEPAALVETSAVGGEEGGSEEEEFIFSVFDGGL